jgi:lipid A 4'-phosphatase
MVRNSENNPGPMPTWHGAGWMLAVSLALALATWIFHAYDLDLRIQRLFVDESFRWSFGDHQPWRFFYRFGTVPGLLLTLIALAGLCRSLISRTRHPHHRKYMVILLTAVLGAGILINAVLKPYWGRPRPTQVMEFAGELEYRPVFQPGTPGKGRSFPCGHSTMGFIFVTLFVFRKTSPLVGYGGLFFGLVYGGLLSLGRSLQGAHFISDSVWSLGLITLVSIAMHYWGVPWLDRLWGLGRELSVRRKRQILALSVVATLLISFLFLTRRTYYEYHHTELPITAQVQNLIVTSDFSYSKADLVYRDDSPPQLTVFSNGFGWTRATHRIEFTLQVSGHRLYVSGKSFKNGYFSELTHTIEIILPAEWKNKNRVKLIPPDALDQPRLETN